MNTRMSSWLQGALCGVALLLISCEKKDSQLTPADSSPALLQVEQGSIEDRILLTGQVVALSAEQLAVPELQRVNSLMIVWMAEDGALVKKGDRVLEFDSSTLLSALEDKRSALASAEKELASQIAKSSLELATKSYEVELARGEVAKAEIAASIPAELTPRREFQEKQLLLLTARDRLAAAEDALSAQRKTAQLEQSIKEVKRTQAARDLTQLQTSLQDLVLHAPRDGMLQVGMNYSERRKYLVGDSEDPGSVIATLPDLSAMKVHAQLFDVDDGAVAAGMAADCVLDAYPQKHWRGTVLKVSPAASADGRDSSRRFFSVEVALDKKSDAMIRPGMSVRVEVIRQRKERTHLVPRAAVSAWAGNTELHTSEGKPAWVTIDFCTELQCSIQGSLPEHTRLLPAASFVARQPASDSRSQQR
jgi:multidrug efflux pump subunit AcrA (membrane-fusion protein)